ncbi:hypothetical protein GCM10009744_21300 [Kribbella alba]|uniref:MFS transporter n=1 Tax=Kribbella alba TaxID=190197 RepID=A0ABN2F7U5_9ACTN
MSDSIACEIPTTGTPVTGLRVVRPARESLVTPQFARLLVMVFGSGLSMYLLTSVVPLYLAANGSGYPVAFGLTAALVAVASLPAARASLTARAPDRPSA